MLNRENVRLEFSPSCTTKFWIYVRFSIDDMRKRACNSLNKRSKSRGLPDSGLSWFMLNPRDGSECHVCCAVTSIDPPLVPACFLFNGNRLIGIFRVGEVPFVHEKVYTSLASPPRAAPSLAGKSYSPKSSSSCSRGSHSNF